MNKSELFALLLLVNAPLYLLVGRLFFGRFGTFAGSLWNAFRMLKAFDDDGDSLGEKSKLFADAAKVAIFFALCAFAVLGELKLIEFLLGEFPEACVDPISSWRKAI